MATARVQTVMKHIRTLVASQAQAEVSDADLLVRFVARQDESAFAVLLKRHGPMVLRVARRVLGREQDAEDVFQAAFLLLARNAASIRKRASVGSWLHGVAHRLAERMRSQNIRRKVGEHRAADRRAAESPAGHAWTELQGVLDGVLARLPEKYRTPLVLCYLEGETQEEVARRLGHPLGTVRSWLARGRAMLRNRLARQGVALSLEAVGATLLASAACARAVETPISLVHLTLNAALRIARGQTIRGIVSAEVAGLIKGGLASMLTTKLKTGVALCLALAVLMAGAGLAARQTIQEQPVEQKAEDGPEPAAKPAADGVLRVVVLDPQGKPLPGANVHSSIWTEEKDFEANRDIETDAAGVAQVELPKTYTILRLWAGKKPFVTLFANWEQAELSGGKGVPAEYTFRLESAVTAGGQILDEKGKPVAGAKVQVRLENDPKPANSDGRVRYDNSLASGTDAATTDSAGRWRVENVPDQPKVELSLLVTHPDYVTDQRWGRAAKESGITTATLRDGTATLTLKAGVVVRGKVTDPDGKPVKDAVVVQGDDPYFGRTTSTFSTDADGQFRLPALPPGKTSITVIAPGWAPQFRPIDVKPDLPGQDFHMGPGKPVRLRVIDTVGNPVPRVSVYLMEWKGSKSIYSGRNPNHPKVPDTGIPGRTDADGVWAWPAAPDDPVKVQISAKGFATLELDITGGSTDRTVTLKAEHRVTGTVTDAVTGKPIPGFTVIPIDVFRKDFLCAERYKAVVGKDGRLDFLATRTDIPLRLRVEAPGYRTQDGPEFRVGDDLGRKQDYRLKPSRPVTGLVVDADGKPVLKAEVLLATPTEEVRTSDDDHNHRSFTDAAGRFEFPDPGEPWAVFARTDAGVAFAEFPADRADSGTLKLRPWGSVRGTFSDGGKPVRGATVILQPIRLEGLDQPNIGADLQVQTDTSGRFEFPRVPPGPVSVRVYLGPWEDEGFRSGPNMPLDLKPGERADLDLGSGGAALTGKVKLSGKVPADLDCTYSLNYLVRRAPGIAPPPVVAAAGFDVRKGWRDAWHETHEGLAYLKTLQTWFVKLAPDGTFRVSGVPAGEYDLSVAVYAKPSGCLVDPLARRVVRVSVTAADAARGELKVPEVAAEVEPVPAVGDTPALSFKRTDGKGGTLADCREKYTVVHFWASWCAPCKKQLPALKTFHERFAARGLATLSLSLDDDAAAWQAALKALDLPWSQGRLGADRAGGVSGVPAYWLLDPTGKIVAKGSDPDEFAAVLEERLRKAPADR